MLNGTIVSSFCWCFLLSLYVTCSHCFWPVLKYEKCKEHKILDFLIYAFVAHYKLMVCCTMSFSWFQNKRSNCVLHVTICESCYQLLILCCQLWILCYPMQILCYLLWTSCYKLCMICYPLQNLLISTCDLMLPTANLVLPTLILYVAYCQIMCC